MPVATSAPHRGHLSEDWESGSGEYRQSGTSRTLTTPAGTVVARFTGQEPERVGGYQVMLLHQAATEREAVDPSPGSTPRDARPTET